MLVVAIVFSLIFIFYLYYRSFRQVLYDFAKTMPTAGYLPIVGHSLYFIGGPEKIYRGARSLLEKLDKTADVTCIWIGLDLYIVPLNPKDVQKCLDNALEKDSSYRFLQAWLGNGLFVAVAQLWKTQRRLLLPVFHNKKVEEYIQIFGEQGETLTKCLREHVGKPSFDVYHYVTSCLLDIVYETAMGKKMDVQHVPDTPYLQARKTVMSIISMRIYNAWMRIDYLFRMTPFAKLQENSIEATHKFTDEVIEEKISAIKDENTIQKGPKDILQLLLEKKLDFTKTELREQLDSITIAGNDTTAIVISYTLMLLGIHKDVQEKVYQELIDIFGNSLRSPTKDDLTKMEYLERVIKETMRLYPPVPVIGRKTTEELKLSTCTVPPGVGIAVVPFYLHRSKKIWGPDAESFDPDRFLPENSTTRQPCAFIPFSFGPRNCIGRHFGMVLMKSVLANVLRTYKISAESFERLKIEILLFPVDGHQITIEKRA